MPQVETSVLAAGSPMVCVSHAERRTLAPAECGPTTVESLGENDTLTEISLGADAREPTARVHWCSADGLGFSVAHFPECGRLFLGAGQIVAVIDLSLGVVADLDHVYGFWSFEEVSRGLVQYGELECVLYSREGHVLERAAVDPPYTVSRSVALLSFSSIVAGETSLVIA